MTRAPDPAEVHTLDESGYNCSCHARFSTRWEAAEHAGLPHGGPLAALASATEAPPVAGMGPSQAWINRATAIESAARALLEGVDDLFKRADAGSGRLYAANRFVLEERCDQLASAVNTPEPAFAALTKPTPPASVSGEVVVEVGDNGKLLSPPPVEPMSEEQRQIEIARCVEKLKQAVAIDRGEPAGKVTAKLLGEAMQDAWGEICDDTKAHPEDIRRDGRKLFYQHRHWTDLIALRLNERLAAAPEAATPSAEDLRVPLRRLEAAATLATEWLDRINDRDGTALGGPQWFELGRAVAKARAALSADKAPSAVGGVEDAAYDWIQGKYLNIEVGLDPADRDFDQEEIVDAFMAGAEYAAALASGETSPEKGALGDIAAERGRQVAAASEAATPSAVGGLAAEFVAALTSNGTNRAGVLSINHDELSALIKRALAKNEAPSAVGGVDRMREAASVVVRRAMQEEFLNGSRWENSAGRVVNRCAVADRAADQIIALVTGETSPERGEG